MQREFLISLRPRGVVAWGYAAAVSATRTGEVLNFKRAPPNGFSSLYYTRAHTANERNLIFAPSPPPSPPVALCVSVYYKSQERRVSQDHSNHSPLPGAPKNNPVTKGIKRHSHSLSLTLFTRAHTLMHI